jgi:hypothetical protein
LAVFKEKTEKQKNLSDKFVNTLVCTIKKDKKQQTPERRGTHMQKNIKEIMIALNQVLTTTVWVNADRQIVSLADELKIGQNNAPRSIEDLSRTSLVGAYVSLQIRTDNFEVPAESLDTKTLALRVKELVFAEAKKIMDAADTSVLSSSNVAKAA